MARLRYVVTVLVLLCTYIAGAQSWTELDPVRGPAGGRTFMVLGLVGVLVVLIMIMILRKAIPSRKSDDVLGMSVTDVGSMQKKGLLTEEETKQVRMALARQMTRKLEVKGAKPTVASLASDPEILRLQALAEAKRRGEPSPELPATQSPAPEEPRPQPRIARAIAPDDVEPTPKLRTSEARPPAPPSEPVFESEPPASPSQSDDVSLPPDVVTMAQLGLISADELENIKRRIREKRRSTVEGDQA